MSRHGHRRILALIPARAGSVGIPRKNIMPFCGKPLIAYSIDAARESGLFDRIVVSTDSPEIERIAREYEAEVPCLRPAELATSSSNVVDAAIHMLDVLRSQHGYSPDLMYLLQPTSPLRDAGDIRRGLEAYERERAPALVTVCRTHHEVMGIESGRLKLRNPSEIPLVNRQERPPSYKQDGSMIYIVNVEHFRRSRSFMPEGETAAFVIPKWKAVDIDDEEDFRLAEVLYLNRGSFEST